MLCKQNLMLVDDSLQVYDFVGTSLTTTESELDDCCKCLIFCMPFPDKTPDSSILCNKKPMEYDHHNIRIQISLQHLHFSCQKHVAWLKARHKSVHSKHLR